MKKIRLNIDELTVETFQIQSKNRKKRGTVKLHSGLPDCGGYTLPYDYTGPTYSPCQKTKNNTCANTCDEMTRDFSECGAGVTNGVQIVC